jgi:hypothetical protein
MAFTVVEKKLYRVPHPGLSFSYVSQMLLEKTKEQD